MSNNNTTYLGKIRSYTKIVKGVTYLYTDIHIKNQEAFKDYKVGQYVKVSIQKIEGIQ
jgi:hypothetical protein